jgi:UDP-N-acetylglucosamine transferase subunit ALG13
MILVTTGTNGAPFDRMLRELDAVSPEEPVVVQHGPSRVRPRGATCVAYLPFGELVEQVRRARLVITHGGVGSVMVALMNGRQPVVVPRLCRFREAVDDHQLAFGRRLEQKGLVTLVTDPVELAEIAHRREEASSYALPGGNGLAQDLAAYLQSLVEWQPA